jgi:HSP20 family protein
MRPIRRQAGGEQMTLIRRPTPLVDLVSFRDAMERLFDERPFRPMWIGNGERGTAPALDLYTTPEAVIAKVALPGIKPEDVDVTIADDMVTISGAFKEEKERSDAGYVHKELTQGKFSRSFSVPTAIKVDAAKAEFKDGLLTLTLPKTEEVKPTHVKVQVS